MNSDASAIEFFSVGDVIGQAIRLYWRNITMILQVLLVPAMGCVIGKIFMHWPFTLYKVKEAFPDWWVILLGVASILIGFAVFLYSVWLMMLRQFALVKFFVSDNSNQNEKSFNSVYKDIKSMQGKMLGVFSLSAVASMAVAIGWSIIIIISAFLARLRVVGVEAMLFLVLFEFIAMFISIACVSIVYWLALNQMILEGVPANQAVRQSWLLTRQNFMRVLLFIFLSMLVTGLITWPLTLPFIGFSVAEVFIKGGQNLNSGNFTSYIQDEVASFGSKAPFYRLVLAQAWETIVSIITWPIFYLSWGLFYEDLRKRVFAPDLIIRLQRLISGT